MRYYSTILTGTIYIPTIIAAADMTEAQEVADLLVKHYRNEGVEIKKWNSIRQLPLRTHFKGVECWKKRDFEEDPS